MQFNSAYEWAYALPSSDRFFNVISQDEDAPIDGNEDRRLIDCVRCSASAGISATLSAEREPMPGGGPQRNPSRIRYTRILPLRLDIDAAGPGYVHIQLRTGQPLDRVERMQLWFFSAAELAGVGSSLWAETTTGDLLLDGDCAADRWRLCEARFHPCENAVLTGLKLMIGGTCRANCWFDALRVGHFKGYTPFVEPLIESGSLSIEPDTLDRGSDRPFDITYRGWLIDSSTPHM